MKREKYISYINEKLSVLIAQTQLYGKLNISSLNIHCEYFYRDLLNIIYDINLENTNFDCSNYPAIDLKDETQKISYQVTSNCSKKKVQDTVKKFLEKDLHLKFKELYILIITSKRNFKDEPIGDQNLLKFTLKNNVLDVSDLIQRIMDTDIKKLREVYEYIFECFEEKFEKEIEPCAEVKTFIKLIEILSDENNYKECDLFKDEPDPNYKIYKRFKDHSSYLIAIYIDYYTLYNGIYEDLFNQNKQITMLQHRKIEIYLKNFSDTILTKLDNNPKEAFEYLIQHFQKIISNKLNNFDEGAIRIMLIRHLIACNVFPNHIKEEA